MHKTSRLFGAVLALAMLASPCFTSVAAESKLPKRITFATFPMGSGKYSIAMPLPKSHRSTQESWS